MCEIKLPKNSNIEKYLIATIFALQFFIVSFLCLLNLQTMIYAKITAVILPSHQMGIFGRERERERVEIFIF